MVLQLQQFRRRPARHDARLIRLGAMLVLAMLLLLAVAGRMSRADEPNSAKLLARWGRDDSYVGGRTSSLSYSADGRWLAWAADRLGVGVVDATGERDIEFIPFAAESSQAFFLPEPDVLLIVATQGALTEVWNVRTRQRLRTLAPIPSPFAVSTRSQRAAYFDGQQWCCRDLKTGEVTAQLPALQLDARVGFVSLSEDGRLLVVSDLTGRSEIWDFISKQRLWQNSKRIMLSRAAYSSDGKTVALARLDQTLLLFDVEQKQVTRTHQTQFVQGMGFLDEDSQLWLVTHHNLEVHDLRQGTLVKSVKTFLETPPWSRMFANVAAAASPDGRTVALDQQGRLRWWNLKTFEPVEPLRWDFQFGFGAAFNGDGDRVVHANAEDGWLERDVATGAIQQQRRSASRVLLLATAPDRSTVAVATPKTIELWPAGANQPRFTFETKNVKRIAFESDSQTLVGIEDSQRPFRRSVATGALTPLNVTTSALSFMTSEAQSVAVGTLNSGTVILKNNRAQCAFSWQTDAICVLSQSRVAALLGREVKVWDIQSCDEVATFKVLSPHVPARPQLVATEDGRLLAATIGQREVRIWRLTDRQEMAVLPTHTAPICSLSFSPDGRRLVTACMDSSIRVWQIDER